MRTVRGTMAQALLGDAYTMTSGTLDTTRRRSLRARRAARAGFTLVELAIVVVIVGILAVLGIVGYRKMIQSSKLSEAQNMISAIRIAQEEYKTERGIYADLGASTYCPAGAGDGKNKVMWNPGCNGGNGTWEVLPVHSDGATYFGYATVAGTGAIGTPLGLSWVSGWANAPTGRPWYVIHAKADLDPGSVQTELVGTSIMSQIFSRNEGE